MKEFNHNMAEQLVSLSEKVKKELQDAATIGIANLKEHLQKDIDEWKHIPLNIGITGESGVGKSSFINAFCELSADDEDGAHVDVVEGTKNIKPYQHPKNKSMVLWDLPKVGTPKFPRISYLKDVEFERYDFFLILSAGRFREDDLWLAQTVSKQDKKFHFVRTQIDVDVSKDKKSHPKTHSRKNVIEKVRKDCLKNLQEHNLSAYVFLIDSYSTMDFDFNSLTVTLIDEVALRKIEAMILSLSVLTLDVLERKVQALKDRIFKISLLSAVGGIPIPDLNVFIDCRLLMNEVMMYKKQLGLDPETMKENLRLLNTEAKELEEKLGLQSLTLATTEKDLFDVVSSTNVSQNITRTLPIVLPVIGSVISVGVSYGLSVASLKHLLNICADDARKMNNELMQKAILM